MFSVEQKRAIADAVGQVLRATHHPELPDTEIQFQLHVDGKEDWNWADIKNNGAVSDQDAISGANPWNEGVAKDMNDLGKLAYTAYCQSSGGKSLISGAKLPEWVGLQENIQTAWTAAACAVAKFIDPDSLKDIGE